MTTKKSKILKKAVGWIDRPRKSLENTYSPKKRGFSIIVKAKSKSKNV